MGLDMYLNKKTYVGNYYRGEKDRVKVVLPKSEAKQTFPIKKIKTERVSEITERVMYWRKVNSVHNWFVENVQDGTDDCGEYYVSEEQLAELVELCEEDVVYLNSLEMKESEPQKDILSGNEYTYKIYEDVDEDRLNLKPTEGFFFGDTEFNEYYKNSLVETIDGLKPLLEESGDFYYQASW